MRLLDKYLARETIGPFLVGVAAFSAILMGTGVLFKLAKMAANGVPLTVVGRLFLLGLPSIVVLTFPMAMLFSSLMGFSRLSGESEMVAMFSSGINLYRMVAPVFLLSLGVAALTWEFNERVVPWSSREAAQLQTQIGEAQAQQKVILPQYEGDDLIRLVIASGYNPSRQTLKGVVFIQFKDGAIASDVTAPEARYNPKLDVWEFFHCVARQINLDGTVRIARLEYARYNIGRRPDEVQRSTVKAEQMNYAQLQRYIQDLHRQGNIARELEMQVELDRKVSLPFTSLVFVSLGVPLGIRPNRKSAGFGVGIGFSVIAIFIFYVITSYLAVLGGQGILDPLAAAWLPNLITLAFGVILLTRAPK